MTKNEKQTFRGKLEYMSLNKAEVFKLLILQFPKRTAIIYLNVLHVLKEVHFQILAMSELYQVFKFWLIRKGLN